MGCARAPSKQHDAKPDHPHGEEIVRGTILDRNNAQPESRKNVLKLSSPRNSPT
jgi:hypothetical protein